MDIIIWLIWEKEEPPGRKKGKIKTLVLQFAKTVTVLPGAHLEAYLRYDIGYLSKITKFNRQMRYAVLSQKNQIDWKNR
ncbi:MAG: hypothetical protein JSV50_04845, partial [Desulfobacteraceae bacterium]